MPTRESASHEWSVFRRLLTALLCTLASCVFPPLSASADIAPGWSDAELVKFSDAIVAGRVAEVATAWDGGTIYT